MCVQKLSVHIPFEVCEHRAVSHIVTVDKTDNAVVYIGQAGVRKNGKGLLLQVQEAHNSIDYWTEAVMFTTTNNFFGPTEISYLENRFCNMAIEAGRYVVKNGNDHNPGNITEETESELEEFIDYAKILMGTLGHKVFEPYIPSTESVDTEPVLYMEYFDFATPFNYSEIRTPQGLHPTVPPGFGTVEMHN